MKNTTPVTIIYALINPITSMVFYVGATRQPLKTRLSAHIRDARGSKAKMKVIGQIISNGCRPLIEELEVCQGYLSPIYAERFWIYQYEAVLGHPLTNSACRSYITSLRLVDSKSKCKKNPKHVTYVRKKVMRTRRAK